MSEKPGTDKATLALQEFARAMIVFRERASEVMRQVAAAIEPIANIVANLQTTLGPALLEIARVVQTLPDRVKSRLAILARHGWYIDQEVSIPAISEMARLLEEGQIAAANDLLSTYFDEINQNIEKRLCTTFPLRAPILSSAFKAHRAGDHVLSVPVFLAQADGICLELIGAQLYSRERNGAATRVGQRIATFEVDQLTVALLYPLTEIFPVAFNSRQRNGQEEILNRHAVLHGESVSYGARVNSCKAMSLMTFTAWALGDLKSLPDEIIASRGAKSSAD